MAKVPNPGGPQFMSRAMRPGVTENPKKPGFDMGSVKPPKAPGFKGASNKPPTPPSFKGRSRGK